MGFQPMHLVVTSKFLDRLVRSPVFARSTVPRRSLRRKHGQDAHATGGMALPAMHLPLLIDGAESPALALQSRLHRKHGQDAHATGGMAFQAMHLPLLIDGAESPALALQSRLRRKHGQDAHATSREVPRRQSKLAKCAWLC